MELPLGPVLPAPNAEAAAGDLHRLEDAAGYGASRAAAFQPGEHDLVDFAAEPGAYLLARVDRRRQAPGDPTDLLAVALDRQGDVLLAVGSREHRVLNPHTPARIVVFTMSHSRLRREPGLGAQADPDQEQHRRDLDEHPHHRGQGGA